MIGPKSFAQSLGDISFGTDSTLELVTWNIEWFPKNGQATADSVAKIIQAIDADVYGIQEIDDSAFFRQVINGLPDYEVHIEPGYFRGLVYVYKSSTVSINGIYKIYDTSPYWTVFPRSPLVMDFRFEGEDFIVINNHYKCCGDGVLNLNDSGDEETRRYEANTLLKQFINLNFPTKNVILLGDLNDNLADAFSNNVFRMFLNDTNNYRFTDLDIANGTNYHWSYPSWPSHLDHIMVTNEMFQYLDDPSNSAETIRIDDYLPGGWSTYDNIITDHRPVGLKMKITTSGIGEEEYQSLARPRITPNPFNQTFQLDLIDYHSQVKLEVVNTLGQAVMNLYVEGDQVLDLDFEGPSGLYFLTITSNGTATIERLIKN